MSFAPDINGADDFTPRAIKEFHQWGQLVGHQLGVCGVLVGGSSIYLQSDGSDNHRGRDFDAVLVLQTKADIVALLIDPKKREKLHALLHIERAETDILPLLLSNSKALEHFDTVRFAGFTASGDKKSVKITSQEHFENGDTCTDHVLSFKDRRVYEAAGPRNSARFRLQQSTQVGNGLTILHDDWIYCGDEMFCRHGSLLKAVAFGVTADLLMTGLWVYGQETTGSLISKRLTAAFFQAKNKAPDFQTFSRHPRFGHWYREWFSKTLDCTCANGSTPVCSCQPETSFLFNTYPMRSVTVNGDRKGRVSKLTERAIERILTWEVTSPAEWRLAKRYDIFSSNSISGFLEATQIKDIQKADEEIFYKIPLDLKTETNGAMLAAQFFPMTQEPFATHDGVLWYPKFDGMTQAELRYRYYTEGREDTKVIQLLLETELRKAEDTLRAYCKSFRTCDIDSKDRSADLQPIHRFFHERLASNGTRLLEFYGEGIKVNQSLISFAKFFSMSISVNGVAYSSLERICQCASHLLDPIRLRSGPTVFGLGDCHGGNVMVSNEQNAQSFHELLYIDYEVAGQHSPILDISKPLYNDTFFQTLMGDSLKVPGSFTWSIIGNSIDITIDGCTDDLSKAILQIKKRYVLTPFFEFSRLYSVDLEDFVPQLGHALFSCAVLTRNYASNTDALMRNLGLGVVLSQASTFDDLWARVESLTGKLS